MKNILPRFTFFTLFTKTPLMAMTTAPTILVLAPAVDFNKLLSCLVWLFFIDLVSGILASYFEWKKNENIRKEDIFFGHKDGFSSDEFKKCFIKGIIYGAFPLIVLRFQQAFMIKTFSVAYITDAQIDITSVILLLFCGNEIFSIFWENLPKCGLNVPKGISNLILNVRTIKDEIKK